MRRSFVSRQREISSRFSRRSSSRVMSGSRVIIRFAISPHGSPAGGAPRRIRSTLYWVDDKSSDFKNWVGPRESRSQVRSRSRNAASSGLPSAFFVSFMMLLIISVITTFVQTHTKGPKPNGCEIRSAGYRPYKTQPTLSINGPSHLTRRRAPCGKFLQGIRRNGSWSI